MLIYLDQNILGCVQDGTCQLQKVKTVQWAYSSEHFEEISRGTSLQLLDALALLGARRLEVSLDANWGFTEYARLNEYENPHEAYAAWHATKGAINYDESLFLDLLIRLFGADNYEDVRQLPARLIAEIERLTTDLDPEQGQKLVADCARIAFEFERFAEEHLSDTRHLARSRRSLGAEGKLGNIAPETVFAEIQSLVAARFPDFPVRAILESECAGRVSCDTSRYRQILAAYSLLNSAGYRTDTKLRRQEGMRRSLSDATHVAHAAFCDALISADIRLCAKARAIYSEMNIGTKVISLERTKEQE